MVERLWSPIMACHWNQFAALIISPSKKMLIVTQTTEWHEERNGDTKTVMGMDRLLCVYVGGTPAVKGGFVCVKGHGSTHQG